MDRYRICEVVGGWQIGLDGGESVKVVDGVLVHGQRGEEVISFRFLTFACKEIAEDFAAALNAGREKRLVGGS